MVTPRPPKAWYLVQCKPRQDERAEENLSRQGFECYRPRLTREALVRGKRKLISTSLFPGYLFIHLGEGDDWSPLRSTRGVSRLVQFGDHPSRVPLHLIEALRSREESLPSDQLFSSGERVRITEGAFAEVEAIFLAMDGHERVVLLLNLLQREQQVVLPIGLIRKT